MDNDTTKAYALLPQEIRDLITDPSTFSTIEGVGTKHGLTTVEIGLLAQATGSLLRGESRPNQFVSMIADVLSMSQENAALIAQDLNRDLFNAVKDSLKQVHSQENTPPVNPIPTPYPGAAAVATKTAEKPVLPVLPSVPIQQTRPISPPPTQGTPARPASTFTSAAQLSSSDAVLPPRQVATPATPSSAVAAVPPTISIPTTPPSPQVIAQQPTQPISNNLESKLGGAFTIKKEVMYTQPGGPAPLSSAPQPVMPPPVVPKVASTTPNAVSNNTPVVPPPIQKDPYRELPS
jgi:hypothetical protein